MERSKREVFSGATFPGSFFGIRFQKKLSWNSWYAEDQHCRRHLAGEEDYGKRWGPKKSCCRGDPFWELSNNFGDKLQTLLVTEFQGVSFGWHLFPTHQAFVKPAWLVVFSPAFRFSVAAAKKTAFFRGVDMHELFVTYLNLKKISTLRLIRSECERSWRVGFVWSREAKRGTHRWPMPPLPRNIRAIIKVQWWSWWMFYNCFPTPFFLKGSGEQTQRKNTSIWNSGLVFGYHRELIRCKCPTKNIQIPGLPGVATLDKPPMCAWRRKRWIWNQMIRRWTRTLDEHFEGF